MSGGRHVGMLASALGVLDVAPAQAQRGMRAAQEAGAAIRAGTVYAACLR